MNSNSRYGRHHGNALIIIIIIVAAIVAGVIVFTQAAGKSVSGHVDEYIALAETARKDTPAADAAALISGRVVIVNFTDEKIDELHAQMDGDLRAEQHADVQTIIALIRQGTGMTASVGVPGLGVSANEAKYQITALVMDTSGQLLARHMTSATSAASGGGMDLGLKGEAETAMMMWIKEQFGR